MRSRQNFREIRSAQRAHTRSDTNEQAKNGRPSESGVLTLPFVANTVRNDSSLLTNPRNRNVLANILSVPLRLRMRTLT